ncbi:MAG TPA: hypothetical protein VK806_01410 [Bacteroidia bacterium]|jgi:hypothetical protein|nr:hypothetical protein [Bacteroidia bacterium]
MKTYITIIILLIRFGLEAQTKTQWALWNDNESLGYSDTSLYKKDYKEKYSHYNYSPIWTCTPNQDVHGFIGSNYQRLFIKFIEVKKDSANPYSYTVIGKTMARNNVCRFKGTIKISNIKLYKYLGTEVTGWGAVKRGILFGDYCFYEDSTQEKSGVFTGSFASAWFIDKKGRVCYDSIGAVCDMFCNNQFAGKWQEYKNQVSETCNWGDYRIPFSKDFDWGTGEFCPNEKYINNGWESYKDLFKDEKGEEKFERMEKKYEKWWK